MKRNKSGGFTFLEIIISISILAIIMGVTYSSLTQIIRSKKILDDARDGKAIADSMLSRMVKEFQLAVNSTPILPPKNNLNQPYVGLPRLYASRTPGASGTLRTTELTFISLSSNQFHSELESSSDLVQITYRVEPDPEDQEKQRMRLIREEVPLIRPAADAYKKTLAFPISNDLLQFEFLFFDSANENWVDTWGKSPRVKLPSLIQLLFKIRSPLGAVQTYSTIVYLPASSDV